MVIRGGDLCFAWVVFSSTCQRRRFNLLTLNSSGRALRSGLLFSTPWLLTVGGPLERKANVIDKEVATDKILDQT